MNTKSEQKRRPPKTAKEKRFLAEYSKTLNATEAASRVYDVSSRDSARKLGSEKLAKLDISDLLDEVGVTDSRIAQEIFRGVSDDDLVIKFKYLELAIKLKHLQTKKPENQPISLYQLLASIN